MRFWGILLTLFLISYQSSSRYARRLDLPPGWYQPGPNTHLVGDWDLSVGMHFWNDHFNFRNLQLSNLTYLAPGMRLNTILRSNDELKHIKMFEPKIDELYLEILGYHTQQNGQFSWSTRLGEIRYLRFPYPDITSMFDLVPGVEDLRKPHHQTSYKGTLFSAEQAWENGFGGHQTWLYWMDSKQTGLNTVESYIFSRKRWGWLDMESRWGRLQSRTFPVGRGEEGYSLYLGAHSKNEFKVGFLYENLEHEGIRTGILVEFTPHPITNFLGKYRADYTRSPQNGFGLQPTLLKGTYGVTKYPPKDTVEVGRITTERTITYWQNGQGRNLYEHIVSQSGNTSGKDLIVVRKEGHRYLRIESLVSRHNQFKTYDDFKKWEKNRQGPAQLAQTVTYIFYKK